MISEPHASRHRVLDWIERTGNRLPEPAVLFAVAMVLVMALSHVAAWLGWMVANPASPDEPIHAISLLTADGLWWALSHLVDNFINFPPLGLVLVGMLGIGIAERSGFIGDLLQTTLRNMPGAWLTPAMVFLGILSSLTLDAGYIVLPPLAAALYLALGRPPLAGLAAVFAGVSAGFSANLFITAVDPLLSGLTQAGAQLLDPDYQVAVTANWWFMIASTFLLTLLGWGVTAWLVEPRLLRIRAENNVPDTPASPAAHPRALFTAVLACAAVLFIIVLLIQVPGAPLYGQGQRFDRWIEVMVPLLFLFFFVPGVVYGRLAGSLGDSRQVVRAMGETMASLGPYIVLAFFAAQFIAFFKYSNLGVMLAINGGEWLAGLQLPPSLLMLGFMAVVLFSNLFIGSASAKYALFAPVFVPMLMITGISPELTQASYRVGDSASNVITPLNPYFIIVLTFMRRYAPSAGLGTLVSLMLPYTLIFACGWGLLLAVWMASGLPLGPGGPLTYHIGPQ